MGLMKSVTKTAKSLPPRIVLYAAEKFGKTSFAAHAVGWNPIFAMTAQETGLVTLVESGLVPEVARFPNDAKSFGELQSFVRALTDEDHDHKAFVLDTGNGSETLCTTAVCDDRYGGSWEDYASFGKGVDLAQKWWDDFLASLDRLRAERGMAIIMLYHSRVKSNKDPAGKDYDQWRPEAIDKLWSRTHKWADVILFGGFKVNVDRKTDKAVGDGERYLRTVPSGAIVAGNRYGLRPEIYAKDGAANLWNAFEADLTRARGASGVSGKHLGAVPTIEDLTARMTKKGRSYEGFKKWMAKAYPKVDVETPYLKLHPNIVEHFLRALSTLPDVPPEPPKEVTPPADAQGASKPVETPKVEEKPAATTTPATEPVKAQDETPPTVVIDGPAEPDDGEQGAAADEYDIRADEVESAAAETAPVVLPAVDEAKERNDLEVSLYEMAEQLKMKPRGLMEFHCKALGHRLGKDAVLSDLPLPILRKLIEAVQQQLEALGPNSKK